ncbi:hypothetical protein SEA_THREERNGTARJAY_20 [Mycobacterium phage ThreeRngTarjay]|nr:hypothetical protein SEA_THREERNGTARJAY_20 [Mycobacterium phage ThreeRngTarjay]
MGGLLAFFVAPTVSDPQLVKAMFSRDTVIMDEVAAAVNRVAMAYPEVRGIEIRSEKLDPGVYAYASAGKMIVFNSNYTSDPAQFRHYVDADIEAHFHPPLGRCTHAELLAYHEAAHIVDQNRHMKPRLALAIAYGRGESLQGKLSRYSFTQSGTLAHGEALAEAFAATLCGSANETEKALFELF